MKKLIIFISIFIGLTCLTSAIIITLSSGNKLENSHWTNLSSVLNKVDISGNNLNIDGKLNISGKLCDTSGACLGEGFGTQSNPGKSCSDLLTKGVNTNGVYYIKPASYSGNAYQVYCDMITDGGGWTMVVAQFENDPVINWNEGIQPDYDPSLVTKKGFALNTSQIPENSNQVAFGKASEVPENSGNWVYEPTFVGYSDFVYTTGNINKTELYNYINGNNYHIHRENGVYYSYHDPEQSTTTPHVYCEDTLTYDELGGIKYSWSFSPNRSRPYMGRGMNGPVGNTNNDYAWTVWVRKGVTQKGSIVTPGLSCKDILDNGGNHGDGIYYIDPNGGDSSDKFEVYCDMTTDGGGWTLVYKNSDHIGLKSIGEVNKVAILEDNILGATRGKLSDSVIKQIYTQQFRGVQYGGTGKDLYCKFQNINNYADGVASNKYCGIDYSSTANYSTLVSYSWNYGFSAWNITNGIIFELNYGDSRIGSHINYGIPGVSSLDSNCDTYGGCHTQVWVK